MTARKSAAQPKKPSKTRAKSSVKSAAVVKRPQPHGGALQTGNPGNAGGTGRPASALRARLVGAFAERVGVIEEIADGKPVKQVDVPLAVLLQYAECPKCGEALRATVDPVDAWTTRIEVVESASPNDRIKALDLAAKYGLGVKDELTVVSPDILARLERQVDVIHRLLPAHLAGPLLEALTAEVWTT